MIADGRRSNTLFIISTNLSSDILPVSNVSTSKLTGSATPIAYATSISHLSHSSAATRCFATHRAAYAALLSTFVQSLPENAPPPCLAYPPYVSTIIFLPVSPESPIGPPITNLPVGFIR